jgi:hypothetical protein
VSNPWGVLDDLSSLWVGYVLAGYLGRGPWAGACSSGWQHVQYCSSSRCCDLLSLRQFGHTYAGVGALGWCNCRGAGEVAWTSFRSGRA